MANATLLHEVTKTGHRMLVVEAGKRHRTSQWFKSDELGNFEGYSFATKESEAHPSGIFKTTKVPHQQLA